METRGLHVHSPLTCLRKSKASPRPGGALRNRLVDEAKAKRRPERGAKADNSSTADSPLTGTRGGWQVPDTWK